jgi:hypothetical protein
LVESLELPLVTNYIQQNSAAEHSTSSLSSAEALKNMKFEGIEIAQIQIPSSAISIPSNFIFFKSLCGGESQKFKLQIYAANKKYRRLADNF